jgi:GDP-D-mannose dehydratase
MILITGAFGQLGRLLTDQLIQTDNKLLLVDRNIQEKTQFSISAINIEEGDLTDIEFCSHLFQKYPVRAIFNFATNSFVERNSQINFNQRCNILDNIIHAIEFNNQRNKVWILHPLSSEIFGMPNEAHQDEETERNPINPYGLQKSIEELKCNFLRGKGYKIYNPILNNAESKFRGEKFFTKRIISNLKKIKTGDNLQCIDFYNAFSSRDFGYAEDYIANFINALNEKKNGVELLGSGINMKIIDFIVEVINTLDIKADKVQNEDELFEFYVNGEIILREKDRDQIDERRVFTANSKNKKAIKIRGGIELIKILVDE